MKLGSMFEIKVGEVYRYLHYTHETEFNVPLVGVLHEVKQIPVKNISEIENVDYHYFLIYHLDVAVNKKLVRFIGLKNVLDKYKNFPILRVPGRIEANGTIESWFIYKVPLTFDFERIKDEAVRYKVSVLSDAEKKLSIGSIINNSRLLEMLDTGWKPEKLLSQYGRTAKDDK